MTSLFFFNEDEDVIKKPPTMYMPVMEGIEKYVDRFDLLLYSAINSQDLELVRYFLTCIEPINSSGSISSINSNKILTIESSRVTDNTKESEDFIRPLIGTIDYTRCLEIAARLGDPEYVEAIIDIIPSITMINGLCQGYASGNHLKLLVSLFKRYNFEMLFKYFTFQFGSIFECSLKSGSVEVSHYLFGLFLSMKSRPHNQHLMSMINRYLLDPIHWPLLKLVMEAIKNGQFKISTEYVLGSITRAMTINSQEATEYMKHFIINYGEDYQPSIILSHTTIPDQIQKLHDIYEELAIDITSDHSEAIDFVD